jgi:hypothetical protein
MEAHFIQHLALPACCDLLRRRPAPKGTQAALPTAADPVPSRCSALPLGGRASHASAIAHFILPKIIAALPLAIASATAASAQPSLPPRDMKTWPPGGLFLRHGLCALFLAWFLCLPAQAQQLKSREACDLSVREQPVEGSTLPSFVGTRISDFRYNVQKRVIPVSGSEPRGTIVNQWPKPGNPPYRNSVLLCVSAGNVASRPSESRLPTRQCPDGSPMRAEESCPAPQEFKTCWDGSRIPTDQRCPRRRPPIDPSQLLQRCPDGSFVLIIQSCPSASTPPEPAPPPRPRLQRCPNGNLIPLTETCPRPTIECPDGSVIWADDECPTQAPPAMKECPDGSTIATSGKCPPPTPPRTKQCPGGLVLAIAEPCPAPPQRKTKQCPGGLVVAIAEPCPAPPPQKTNQCPGGLVVAIAEPCPAPPPPKTKQCPGGPAVPVAEPCPPPPCAHGTRNPATGRCEPVCQPGSTYDSGTRQCEPPTCQEGAKYNPATGRCQQTPSTAVVPELAGKGERYAIDSLRNAGFTFVGVCCVQSNIVRGNVAFTKPRGGSRLPPQSQIIYVLSTGPVGRPSLLLLIGAVAAGLIGAAAAWVFIPKRPRISVRIPVAPAVAVAWGDPIQAVIDVEMPTVTSNVEFPPYKDPGDE